MANLATINNNLLADSGIDPVDLIVGTGTVNYVPKFTAEGTIANSIISATSTLITNNFGTSNLYFGQSGSTRFGFTTGTATLAFSTGLPLVLGTYDGQPLVFGTNNTEYIRLNISGNLGLSVIPAAWANGYVAFQIENSALMAIDDRIWMYANGYYDGVSNKYIVNGYASRYYQANSTHVWEIAASGVANNTITYTPAMTLNASGRLLVGQTNDDGYLFQLNGVSRSKGEALLGNFNNLTDFGQVGIYSTASLWADGFGALVLSARHDEQRPILFTTYNGTSVAERARITPSGVLRLTSYGSGSITGTPTYRLAVDSVGNIIEVTDGGGTITGGGTAGQVAFFNGSSSIGSEANFTWDSSNNVLTTDNGRVEFRGVQQDAVQSILTLAANNAAGQSKGLYIRLIAGGTPEWQFITGAVSTDAGIKIIPNGSNGLTIPFGTTAASFSNSLTVGDDLTVTDKVGIGGSVGTEQLFVYNAMAKLPSSSGWGVVVQDTNTDGLAGRGGAIAFGAYRTDSGRFNAAAVAGAKSNSTGGNENGDLVLYSSVASSLTERVRVLSAGRTLMGPTMPTDDGSSALQVSGGDIRANEQVVTYRRFVARFNSTGNLCAELYEDGASTNGGTLALYGLASGTVDTVISAAPTKYNYINNNANFGIGYSSDQSFKFAVNGTGLFSSNLQLGTSTTTSISFRITRTNASIPADANYFIASANTPNHTWIEGGYMTGELSGVVTSPNSGYPYFENYAGQGSATVKAFGFVNKTSGTFTSTDFRYTFTLARTGAIKFDQYGSGSFTGTRAYSLAVDSSGNIIESTLGNISGSGSANQIAYWTGSNTIDGSSNFLYNPFGEFYVSSINTAGSGIAVGMNLNPTLIAGANGDVLSSLLIRGTFTNGAFTNVQNWLIIAEGSNNRWLRYNQYGLWSKQNDNSHVTALNLENAHGTGWGVGMNFTLGYDGTGSSVGTPVVGARIQATPEQSFTSTASTQDASLVFQTVQNGILGSKFTLRSDGLATLHGYGAGTFTGTVTYNLAVDSSGNIIETAGGVVDGSGTANRVSKWSDANTLTDANITDNGSTVRINTIPLMSDSRIAVGTAGGDQTYASIFIGGALTTGTSQYALLCDPQLAGTENYAVFANARIKANTSVTNTFGVYIPTAEKLTGASILNNYALYIANQTSGSSTNYSIYSSGGLNYFGGRLGLRVTNPGATLDVSGDAALVANFNFSSNGTYLRWQNNGTSFGDIGSAATLVSGGATNDFAIHARSTFNIIFSTDFSEKVRINSGGNVSIGNTNNTYKLDVTGTIAISTDVTMLRFGNLLRWGFQRTASDNRYVSFMRNMNATAVPVWTIDGDNGNLGLAVTPSTWSLGKAIEVGNPGNGIWNYGVSNTNIVTNVIWNEGHKYASNGAATQYAQNNGNHEWLTAASGTAGATVSFTQAMTLGTNSGLSIGSTSAAPANGLRVQGSIRAAANVEITSASAYLLIGEGTGASEYGAIDWDASNNRLQIATQPFAFGTGGSQITLTTAGFVGIRRAPSVQFDVNGSTGGINLETAVTPSAAVTPYFTILESGVSRTVTGYNYESTTPLAMVITQTAGTTFGLYRASDDAVGSTLRGMKSRGTAAAPGSVANGDTCFAVEGYAWHGAGPNHPKFGGGVRFVKDDNWGTASTYAPQRTEFYNANSTTTIQTNMVIFPNGNTSLGTTSYFSNYKLYVSGTTASSNIVLYRDSAVRGALSSYLDISGGGTDYSPTIFAEGGSGVGSIYFCVNGSATRAMSLMASGELWLGYTSDQGAYLLQVNGSVYASAYYESSDIRLKQVLNQHQGFDFGAIEYRWADARDNKLHWGYSAQEVMKFIPDAVNENKDGFLTLDYNQAHTYKIAMLEKRIAELEQQLKNK